MRSSAAGFARALGWFSVALGIPLVAKPGAVSRFVGVRDSEGHRSVLLAVGVRELLAGAGLLSGRRPAGWLWSRVAGDGMDLALLAAALRDRRNDQRRLTATTAAIAGVTLVDLIASVRSSRSSRRGATVRERATITVRRPVDEVYGFWRDFEHLPRFMYHLESVRATGDDRSHWVARAPTGASVEWDAVIVADTPGELIAWRALEGASIDNSGSVRFAPAPRGQGTEVTVELEYSPPGGKAGVAVARLFGEEPRQQMRDDLRRLKQVLETGEVVRSEGSPDGTRTQRQFRQHEAQPLG